MADRGTRYLALLVVAETGSFVTIDAFKTVFSPFALLPYFLLGRPYPRTKYDLFRVASSVQQSSATLQQALRSTCSCVVCICLMPEILLVYFPHCIRSSYFLRWRDYCALVLSTLACDATTLITSPFV